MALFTGGALTAVNGFIQENAQIGRYPKNQMEWNGFLQELAKLIIEYEGTFDATASGFDSAYIFTGFTYYRYGKIVMIKLPVQEETSDSAAFLFSGAIPKRIRPTVTQSVPCVGLVDNGTPITTCGQARIDTDGALAFGLDSNLGGFTTSGKKGFGDAAGNVIIYSLFDAKKIN